ncbi:protein phosphatase CheZ [Litoribrevibacter albus]|uniref:Protein phosphatase CheZ n=1 Tax=Litoribrevibacter albus TaxID=1473156 RepID=A0AA37SDC8_9GAMM|nr:protein phosphatase CheZ [Litoribrevibacter albus]GLQ32357.1 protein phosphatase CheZ [Litoribrevibacter albus]
MSDNKVDHLDEFQESIRQHTKALVDAVEAEDFTSAIQHVQSLSDVRDQNLYKEIGRLTRALHNSIKNFEIDISEHNSEMSQMADASDRLDYVIQSTNKAANKTMDLVEDTIPVVDDLKAEASELSSEWGRLLRREMDVSEFRNLYKRIDEFLKKVEGSSGTMSTNLSNILLAQDYQDLTGQVIQKVIKLVKGVEDDLVRLVKMAGLVERITGIENSQEVTEAADELLAEGPIIDAEERENVVTSQDEVDDLLSSLGF